MFFKNDLSVSGHISFQLTAGIVDRHAHFKGGDIVLLNTEWSYLRDLAVERLVAETLHLDPCRLSEVYLSDIRLVDLALHIHLVSIAERHHQRRRAAQHQNRAHRIANFNIAR